MSLIKRELTKDELSKLSLRGRWNKEKILNLARECGSLRFIVKNFSGAVKHAGTHKFWHEVIAITGKVLDHERWSTKDKVITAMRLLNVTSVGEWINADAGYFIALKKGWGTEIEAELGLTRDKKTPDGYWTKKRISEKFADYENREALLASEDRGAYAAAQRLNMLDEVSIHFTRLLAKRLTVPEVMMRVNNYKKGEYSKWMAENMKHYIFASGKKILPEIRALLGRDPVEEVMEIVNNYKNGEFSKWRAENMQHYGVAGYRELLPEIHALLD